MQNPFAVTKASMLSPEDIVSRWVPLYSSTEHTDFLQKFLSPFPLFIVGGKGCGKTHLMRFYSFESQVVRHTQGLLEGLQRDGFIGVYARCELLNADKFSGKGIHEDTWQAVFETYFEVWIGLKLLETYKVLLDHVNDDPSTDRSRAVTAIVECLSPDESRGLETVDQCIAYLRNYQLLIDRKVNNAAISQSLSIDLKFTRNQLMVGLPKALSSTLPGILNVKLHYLIDEFELLSFKQQCYINTLVRQKDESISLKIGSRLYGVKTYLTNSGEENKEGSEYESLVLDAVLRASSSYRAFAREIVDTRLTAARRTTEPPLELFQSLERDELLFEILKTVRETAPNERPHFRHFARSALALEGSSKRRVDSVVRTLQVPEDPFVEKLSLLHLYRLWSKSRVGTFDELESISSDVAALYRDYFSSPSTNHKFYKALGHFRQDLIAQLLRENGKRGNYSGLDSIITLSAGFPRALLVILRHIWDYADFNGEHPESSSIISTESQNQGTRKGSNWFFEDARIKGPEGFQLQQCIERLAGLFRANRFSDRIPECSVIAFSVPSLFLTEEIQKKLKLAVEFSLLYRIDSGHIGRNSEAIQLKYQLNPILSPKWDLPVGSRGTIELSREMCAAIFTEEGALEFPRLLNALKMRYNAPFGLRHIADKSSSSVEQLDLLLE